MSAASDRTGAWRRVAVEGAVIVSSILLAFAIDAAWDERKERSRERGLLESLESEFQENLLAIQRVADIHKRDEAAAVSLAELLTAAQPGPSAETERLLSLVYLGGVTLNVSSGALDSYLSGGNPEVIENRRLRTLLHSWSGLLEESAEEERRAIRQLDEVFKPFLIDQYSLPRLFAAHPARLYGELLQEPSDSAALATLLRQPQTSNHVTLRLTSVRVMQREVERLAEAAQEILQQIRSELGSE